MLKQAICVRCMIKNILGLNANVTCLSWIIVIGTIPSLQSTDPVITVSDLSAETVAKLHSFSDLHNGPFTINVAPFSYSNSFYKLISSPFNALQNTFNAHTLVSSFFSFVLSFGWISYLVCSYIAYRVYCLIKQATSWSTWCSDEDLVKNDREYLLTLLKQRTLLHRSKKNRTACDVKKELAKEELLLQRYCTLTTFLEKHGLLKFFPYVDTVTRKQAVLAYEKI